MVLILALIELYKAKEMIFDKSDEEDRLYHPLNTINGTPRKIR
tara:strand:+ start:44245 stop:44373 length:129 start_codon:yes stop_codon:yes gene_type:complete